MKTHLNPGRPWRARRVCQGGVWLTLLLTVSAVVAQAPAPTEAGSTPTNVLTLSPVVINEFGEILRTNHPSLRAARTRSTAANLNAKSIRAWQDPTAKFGGTVFDSRGSNSAEEGDLIYGVEQKLPLFGKAKAERAVAEAEASTTTEQADARFQFLRRDLARAMFTLALAGSTVEIGREDVGWLDQMKAAMEARYAGGGGSPVDVLRVQNERSKRTDQLLTDTRKRDDAQVMVNRLLGLEVLAPLPELKLPEVADPVTYSQRLVDFALKYEPRLKVLARELQLAETSVVATRKSRLPDLALGAEGRQYSGDGGFREGMFTVSLNLPWFNRGKYRAELERDQHRLTAAQLERTDAEFGVGEEVHHLTVEIDAARREALLYRDDIIPRSQTALEAAHASWTSGRGMLFDVMEARRMLLEGRLMYVRAVTMQWSAMSELVLCCGLGDLEALQMLGKPVEPAPKPATTTP